MAIRIALIIVSVLLFAFGLCIVLFDNYAQGIAGLFGVTIARMIGYTALYLGVYKMPVGGGMMAGALALFAAAVSLILLRLRESRAPYMVETPFLVAMVNPVTGEVDGEFRRGQFAGSRVRMLPLFYIRKVMEEMREVDPEGLRVIEQMLDHFEPDWRDYDPSQDVKRDDRLKKMFAEEGLGATATEKNTGKSAPASSGGMTREQALAVLGLSGTPEPEAIKSAYRSLMMKIHPDQGGSAYLAAQLNEAKNLLLR